MKEMLDPAVRADWIARGREQIQVLTNPQIEVDMLDFFRDQGRLAREPSGKNHTRA